MVDVHFIRYTSREVGDDLISVDDHGSAIVILCGESPYLVAVQVLAMEREPIWYLYGLESISEPTAVHCANSLNW